MKRRLTSFAVAAVLADALVLGAAWHVVPALTLAAALRFREDSSVTWGLRPPERAAGAAAVALGCPDADRLDSSGTMSGEGWRG